VDATAPDVAEACGLGGYCFMFFRPRACGRPTLITLLVAYASDEEVDDALRFPHS
jgi:hypothetical protein